MSLSRRGFLHARNRLSSVERGLCPRVPLLLSLRRHGGVGSFDSTLAKHHGLVELHVLEVLKGLFHTLRRVLHVHHLRRVHLRVWRLDHREGAARGELRDYGRRIYTTCGTRRRSYLGWVN